VEGINLKSNIGKSYLAGFLDADGSISIIKIIGKKTLERLQLRSPFYLLMVTISNNYEPFIIDLVSIYGGSKKTTKAKKANWNTSYCWTITSRAALNFLNDIFPYLRIKKRQAEIAIDFQKQKSKAGRKNFKLDARGRILKGSTLRGEVIEEEAKARDEIMRLNSPKGKAKDLTKIENLSNNRMPS